MNKNIIILLIVLVVAVGAYFFFTGEDIVAPVNNEIETETETTTEIENTDYIGMTPVRAEAKAQADGVMFRVVKEDGQQLPTTRDFQEGRINATVEAGIVTEYTVETRNSVLGDKGGDTESVNHDAIIGMTTVEAEAYAVTNGVDFRTGTIDGEGMPVTSDYRVGRITSEIENGLVIGYTVE